jgi:predicted  nucleic acid-binding Zn-ribbon protein
MGPTNVALVKLFNADRLLRDAQARLDEAGKNVRLQDRRVNDLDQKVKEAQTRLRQQQARAAQLDLDMRTRDAQIERFRTQQQTAKNNKEYQAFLMEINTAKVDRGKVEDEAVKVMDSVEKVQAEVNSLAAQLEAERGKLTQVKSQLGDTLAKLQVEVDAMKPAREAAAAALPSKVRDAFDRMADRYDGEAMAKLTRPDRRREEYSCDACNMELAIDVYNKLHSRDEVVFCPSCRRILYIPEDLTPEAAIGAQRTTRSGTAAATKAKAKKPKAGGAGPGAGDAAGAGGADEGDGSAAVTIEKRAKGQLGQLLASAQGESVQAAVVSGSNPVECEVYLDNELAGYYKGRDPGHLERNVKYRLEQVGRKAEVRVVPVAKPDEPAGGAPQSDETSPEMGMDGSSPRGEGETSADASESPEPTSSHAEAQS